jgi:hypothetical protein
MKALLAMCCLGLAAAGLAACNDGEDEDGEDGDGREAFTGEAVPLKEAKLIIEHNATDLDTGFQGFLDGEGWEQLDVVGPGGEVVLHFEGQGSLASLGLTELFFESVEPENAEVPLEDTLAKLPPGEYTFEGPVVPGAEGGTWTQGVATLSHSIPAGPVLLEPEDDAAVGLTGVVMRWEAVTEDLDGQRVEIVAYQLIVEPDADPATRMIGTPGSLSVYLDPAVTSLELPAGLLRPATAYNWEILAVASTGNQTLSSSTFRTE